MHFAKMHGLGNDYVFIDCFRYKVRDPGALAVELSDRHRGIGSDGLILIGPSTGAHAAMRIFNADGSEAEMCGNGIRCVAKYVFEHGLAKPGGPLEGHRGLCACSSSLEIETARGTLTVGLVLGSDNKTVQGVRVNMGIPILDPSRIPVSLPGEKAVLVPVEIAGRPLEMTCVSMGNPHAVFFCNDPKSVDLEIIGPAVENHQLFPNRTNVHFVGIIARDELEMVTWERGSGRTMACGTGAAAVCVAANLAGLCVRTLTAHLPGGDLHISWDQADGCVYMTGPAEEVFTGEFPAADRYIQ